MEIIQKSFHSLDQLKEHICSDDPTFYHGSRTSTVIPYEKIEEYGKAHNWSQFLMGDLGQLPERCELNSDNHLLIEGPVTWKEAREYCRSQGRNIMTSPTEELAAMLSGVATSCTGERCFGFGTLREQLVKVDYLDDKGTKQSLFSDRNLCDHSFFEGDEAKKLLAEYQESYRPYKDFKNAPFPRLEKETDLMTGTEGQLGIVVEGLFKTAPNKNVTYIFMALPKWEESLEFHMEVFEKVQGLRDKVYSCELIDENSWSYLPPEDRPREGKDIVFLEIENSSFEEVYEEVLSQLSSLGEENIFEVPEGRCRELRMGIPRAIFEVNSQMGVTKKGTDVQVRSQDFENLMKEYRAMAKLGVPYNLFGHFGDAHLHFNYMPKPEEEKKCQLRLEELYQWVHLVQGSPFAEHGIGLLKQNFIRPYYSEIHFKMFQFLKEKMDPKNKFFPKGFMSMEAAR